MVLEARTALLHVLAGGGPANGYAIMQRLADHIGAGWRATPGAIWAAVNLMLAVIWATSGGGHPWFIYPLLGWGIGVVAHGASAYLMADTNDIVLEREQRRFTERTDTRSS